jgi:hypothetical protein
MAQTRYPLCTLHFSARSRSDIGADSLSRVSLMAFLVKIRVKEIGAVAHEFSLRSPSAVSLP